MFRIQDKTCFKYPYNRGNIIFFRYYASEAERQRENFSNIYLKLSSMTKFQERCSNWMDSCDMKMKSLDRKMSTMIEHFESTRSSAGKVFPPPADNAEELIELLNCDGLVRFFPVKSYLFFCLLCITICQLTNSSHHNY